MATRAEVTNLYRTMLGREPDAEGLNYWVNSGFSLGEIQSRFMQTPEYVQNQQMIAQQQAAQRQAQLAAQAEAQRQAQIQQQIAAQQEAQRQAQLAAQAEAQRQAQIQAQQQAQLLAQQEAQRQAQIQAQQAEAQRQAQLQAQQQAQIQAQQLAAQQEAQRQATVTPQAAQVSSTAINPLIDQLYQQQLGRAPDPEGAAYWQSRLAAGATPEQIRAEFAKSKEGQNFDTQLATSAYRQLLGRNPEQEGYQYWQSLAQSGALTADELRAAIEAAAQAERQQRQITENFTQMQLPDLEADPWANRYATTSIYDIPANEADRINISYIDGIPVQFVNPVTQQAVVSNFGGGQFTATPGEETISSQRIDEATQRALNAGSLTQTELDAIVKGLTTITDPAQVRQLLATPTGYVVVDPKYGQQIGENDVLQAALDEAKLRQEVLDKVDTGYYQASDVLGQAYIDAGLDFPFMTDTYKADTMMTQANALTPNNFNAKVNQLISTLGNTYGRNFGGMVNTPTALGGQYYSETGLQPGFTPFGTEGTMFRSGVAGYTPNLPTGFQFGAPPVNATFREYRPGAFQPADVTTGGFITGYTQAGEPIYSTYANPNVNVAGVQSQLNPFNAQQQTQIADLQAQLAALQANPVFNTTPSGG